ncbi:MAG: Uma2 family endonuclease [Solirubrobacteraceae bacterium]
MSHERRSSDYLEADTGRAADHRRSTIRGPYPVPDIAVDVRSPSTWRYDTGAKKNAYEREGLRELWLVDGEHALLRVLRRSSERQPTFDLALELDRNSNARIAAAARVRTRRRRAV